MNSKLILALDQGTTGTRAMLFDHDGLCRGESARKHRQIYPRPGWVSHDPEEIFLHIKETITEALEKNRVNPGDIAAIGITNQRETLVVWDKVTGRPPCDAVVWQCRRSAGICENIKNDGMEKIIRQKTGLLVDPYFTATKLRWILDNVNEAKELLNNNRLLAGTMDSYIIWRLTGGKIHGTDYTNAARTMLFNIHTLEWDDELLDYFSIPKSVLPQALPSSGIIGYAEPSVTGLSIPIGGAAGDQHAALFGQHCYEKGDVKNTYGTGCFILINTGNEPVAAGRDLLTTIGWHINGETVYALEGSVFNAGSAVEWLIDSLGLAADPDEINRICEETPHTGRVFAVPAFSGLGAPHWDMYARGAIVGMSLQTERNEIIRAVMESIAFQTKDVLEAAAKHGVKPGPLRVDGGVSQSHFLMEFQAGILGLPIIRPSMVETTALGAAYLAGLAVGYWKDKSQLKEHSKNSEKFLPAMNPDESEEAYRLWLKAVERAKNWAEAEAV